MSTRFETQTQNDDRPVRGQTLQKGEVHENRGTGDRDTVRVSAQSGQRGEKGRKGGPRHYDLGTELGGGRPK